jgi:glycerophosphoryl diester phosphodiesterase
MAFKHPYLAGQKFICFAHRGGGLEQPENSASAFSAARAMGYRYIETDVQATADGILIVFHDDTLERTTDGSGTISALPYSEVCQALIGGVEPIMTLEQALEQFPDIRFNIDIKTEKALQPTLDLITRMKCFERINLASFSDNRLRKARRHLGPEICTSAGPQGVFALKLGSWGVPLAASPVDCAQVPISEYGVTIVTSNFIQHCNKNSVAVHVWTINEEDEMRRLIRLGVNGLISDRPTLLKRVAMDEGVWAG